jgi:NodT family efflux transporter outer membrane factor (OMF) lipoprotein
MQEGHRALAAMAVAIWTAGLSGCTVGPDFVRPTAPTGADYTTRAQNMMPETAFAAVAGGAAQRFASAEDIPGQWWTLFHSARLNALIEEALKANPTLTAAQSALRQARETLYADQGGLFPTISASGTATREKNSAAVLGAPPTPAGATDTAVGPPVFSRFLTLTSASLSVSYTPDVFGGVHRQAESAEAQAEYQRFQLEATYLTLTSNVVTSAVTLASLSDQIAATETIIKIESNQLDMMRRQFALGATARADVLSQQATLAQTEATLPPLRHQIAQARNQLMTYVGRFPSQDKGESFDLSSLSLPEALPVSLPSKLIEQRPDVRAAEAQLHQASANIGVAIANQLPQFTITGQLGSTSSGLDKLFSPGTGLWSIGGSIAQTIFDGGTLEHRKRAAVAGYRQTEAQYRSTVLSAFQDVANALRALQTDADALKAQALAEQSAQESLDLARQQYQLGAINYLTLLNAEQTYQNALLNRVRAQAARYSDTAALFQALGGGWWNRSDVAPESEGTPDRFALPPIEEIRFPR